MAKVVAVSLMSAALVSQPSAAATAPAATSPLPAGISLKQVQAHVIAPPNTQNIQIEVVDPAREIRLAVPIAPQNFVGLTRLDVNTFGSNFHTYIKDQVVGYYIEVRQNGTPVYAKAWNWAQTPSDASKPWGAQSRQHIASVSKFITAVGLVRVLDSKNISYDAKIIDYLPTYWSKGTNINQITFRELLQHKSGFYTGSSASDYFTMKGKVAAGVTTTGTYAIGTYHYENMNYGLDRILIPIILGQVSKDATWNVLGININDQAWDMVTIQLYQQWIQTILLTPAGVTDASFAPVVGSSQVLAYRFPAGNNKGWNSGDLSTMAGGAGWHMTPQDVLNAMYHARNDPNVLPAGKCQYMLDNYFGVDQQFQTAVGNIYNKVGNWSDGNSDQEQCVAYFFPAGMECVVFVNSPINTQNYSLRDAVHTAFLNSLTTSSLPARL
jgi:hypothetical protein